MKAKLTTIINKFSLSQRFMLASLVILLTGMLAIGAWVERQVVNGVVKRTGATTAMYVDSILSPLVQELGVSDALLPEHKTALDSLLIGTPMGEQIIAINIWSTRGKLLYSTRSSDIGKTFPMSDGLLRARLGEVASEVSELEDDENQALAKQYDQLLEIYSPIWLSGTGQIIAVAEFYHRTDELDREVTSMKITSWVVVGLAILIIYLLLAGFVRGASTTIQKQQEELAEQVNQLTNLLAQNQELHERVRNASASVAILNEGYLKRIGAELHDGPAQDLGLAVLKLDSLAGRLEKVQAGGDLSKQFDEVRSALQNAMREMRAIAAGLSLPQLANLDLEETVRRVVRAHERRVNTQVELELSDELPKSVDMPARITVYRLIQEALNNGFRHAGGVGQQVRVNSHGFHLNVEVSDDGPGFEPGKTATPTGRLGLSGMRERVESLGGTFKIDSKPGQGTRIFASLPYKVNSGEESYE